MNIAIFTNILNPYRTAFFDRLAKIAENQGIGFRVYAMVGEKSDRPWKYDDFKRSYTVLLKSKTLHIRNVAYLHFNSGVERELKVFHPNVVVMAGSYLQPTNLLLLMYKKKYGYKTVFWSESHFAEVRNYGAMKVRLREFIRKQTVGKMDAFWYPGQKAEEFVDYYRKPEAVKIQVPNTIDNTYFCSDIESASLLTRNDLAIDYSTKIMFTPARLSHEKGMVEFCSILKELPNRNYVWLIAGEGPLEDTIRKLATKYNLNIRLLGQRSQNEVKQIYKLCDIFLLCSKSDSNPLTVIEALWMKKPLFVSEHVGNHPEAVENGKNGYVFDYADIKSSVHKLKTLLNSNENWYQEASHISFSKARTMFDIDRIAVNAIVKTKELV